ncbi:MAG TPA: CRTAC1 family protein [Actinomycetota bacterium]|nr:CRTAC1 family protein [Actinomycetota bacterium]
MTISRLITRITLLLLVGGLVLSGSRDFDLKDTRSTTRAVGADYSFEDVTGEMGLADATRTWGSTWNDFDEDGKPDLWVGRHWRQPRLFRNVAATRFEEISDDDFRLAAVDRHACVWGEANGDGEADLYCVRGADMGKGSGANQLFVSTPNGFKNRAFGNGVSNPNGRGRTANWLDYDSDGDLDLFVGNLTRAGFPNAMFRNDGEIFTQVVVGLEHELSTVSSSWADWDLDGDPDLLVLQHSGRPAVAYENVGGAFRMARLANVSGRHWSSGAWGDYDGDGRPDLHLVSPSASWVLRNTPSGFEVANRLTLIRGRMSTWLDVDNDTDLDLFVVQGAAAKRPAPNLVNRPDFLVLNTREGFKKLEGESFRGPKVGNGDAVSAADYDRDGRIDLFTTNGLFYYRGPNALLHNRSAAGNWLGLDLDGTAKNPMGFGAEVIVRIGDRTIHRQVTDQANYRSQNEPGYVHVGLDDAIAVQIEVRWPNGERDCLASPANAVLSVLQGATPCGLQRN